MPYQKTNWVNEVTPLSAANFNNMEAGIYDAQASASNAISQIDTLKNAFDLNLDPSQSPVNTALTLGAGKVLELSYGENQNKRTLSVDLTPVVSDLVLGVADVRANNVSVVSNGVAYLTIPTKISDLQDDRHATRILVTDDSTRISEIQENDLLFLVED